MEFNHPDLRTKRALENFLVDVIDLNLGEQNQTIFLPKKSWFRIRELFPPECVESLTNDEMIMNILGYTVCFNDTKAEDKQKTALELIQAPYELGNMKTLKLMFPSGAIIPIDETDKIIVLDDSEQQVLNYLDLNAITKLPNSLTDEGIENWLTTFLCSTELAKQKRSNETPYEVMVRFRDSLKEIMNNVGQNKSEMTKLLVKILGIDESN